MAAPNLFVNLVLLAACCLSAATGAADAQESATDILGAMYWTHRDTGVYRAARDGSEIKQLLAIKNPDGLAIDAKAQKLYFTVSHYPAANADKICRINLDGSGFEEFVTGLNFTGDLVLDPESAKLYLTSVGSGTIFEIDIASKSPRDLVTGLKGPDELALDLEHRHLYFTSSGDHKIERIGLDGTGRREVVGGLGTPFGLALDPGEQQLYFVEAQGNLRRVRLDGSQLTTLAQGLKQPDGLAIDTDNRKLYWTENGKICQANTDGTNVEDLIAGKTAQYGSLIVLPPKDDAEP